MTRIPLRPSAAFVCAAALLAGCASTLAPDAPSAAADQRPAALAPRRAPSKAMEVWIAAWEDGRGDLHAPSTVYVEVDPTRWTYGDGAPFPRYTVLRPLQVEERPPPAADPGAGSAEPAERLPVPPAGRPDPRNPNPREDPMQPTALRPWAAPRQTLLPLVLLAVSAAALLPEAAHAGTGGAELTPLYATLTGWMTGFLGRTIMTEQVQAFAHDWVSPPGETVEDLLQERCWLRAELAERTGLTRSHIDAVVTDRVLIDAGTASRLARVLGGTARFWLAREARYRAPLERCGALEAIDNGATE